MLQFTSRALPRATAVALLAALAACSDNAPPVPATLVASGETQLTGTVGEPIAAPLSVKVTDAKGRNAGVVNVTVTGAAVNNVVLLGLPAAVSAGAVIQGVVYKANTVCLSCTNTDNTSIDVNTATYRITVIGY